MKTKDIAKEQNAKMLGIAKETWAAVAASAVAVCQAQVHWQDRFWESSLRNFCAHKTERNVHRRAPEMGGQIS